MVGYGNWLVKSSYLGDYDWRKRGCHHLSCVW